MLSKYRTNKQQGNFILIVRVDEDFVFFHLQPKMLCREKPDNSAFHYQKDGQNSNWKMRAIFSGSSLHLMKKLKCLKVRERLEIKIPSCHLGSSQGF